MAIRRITEFGSENIENLEDDSYFKCCGEIFPSTLNGEDQFCPKCGCEGPPVSVSELLSRFNEHSKLENTR